jgi:hypothetical protein
MRYGPHSRKSPPASQPGATPDAVAGYREISHARENSEIGCFAGFARNAASMAG